MHEPSHSDNEFEKVKKENSETYFADLSSNNFLSKCPNKRLYTWIICHAQRQDAIEKTGAIISTNL